MEKDKSKKPQNHGLTHEQMAELRDEKMAGTQKFIKANKDNSVEIPEVEKGLLHASLQPRGRNQETGEFDNPAFIQVFHPADFERMNVQGAFKEYQSVTIVHDPRSEKEAKLNKNAFETSSLGGNKSQADVKEKAIDRMPKKELQAKYLSLYTEDAPAEMEVKDLREKIEEKLEFLERERALNGPGTTETPVV